MSEVSKPHSIREALIPHSWEWKDDEEGATATSVHASECRRCAADAALDSLEEQLEALRAAAETVNEELATWEPTERSRAILNNVLLDISNPAISPRPTMPLGSSGRSDISARADDGHYCIGPDCPDCAPASRPS